MNVTFTPICRRRDTREAASCCYAGILKNIFPLKSGYAGIDGICGYVTGIKVGKCSVICPSHNWIHWLFISRQNMVFFNLTIVFFVRNC